MKNLRHFSTLLFAALLTLIAFVCASCGGNGTASPVLTGGNPTPQISVQIISPNPSTTTVGNSLQFSAIVTGTSNQAVTWSVTDPTGAPIAIISSTGLFQTGNQEDIKKAGIKLKPAEGTNFVYTIHAQSVADPTKSATATATVTVNSVVGIEVNTPSPNEAQLGGSLQFTATVTGTSNTAVTWKVAGQNGAPTASISSTGLFSTQTNQDTIARPKKSGVVFNPAGDSTQTFTYTVTATSVADPTKSASGIAIVDVSNFQPSVTVTPGSTTIDGGETVQYSAVVNGATDQAVTWSVSGGLSISSSGILTTGENGPFGTFTVTATSVVGHFVGTASVKVDVG